MCKAPEYDAKTPKTANIIKTHVSPENITQKYQMSSVHEACTPINWPKDSQKYDIYTNEEGIYELLFPSQQPKAKDFRRHCFNVLFPDLRQQLTSKMKEDRQQAIKGRNNQIKALEFRNEEHQQRIFRLNKEIDDLLANRHVARRECFDNVLYFIKKNRGEVHPYNIIQCQYKQLENHKRWLKLRYANMEVADKCDDPNAIHRWNRFKREVIKKTNYYKNHFSLTKEK